MRLAALPVMLALVLLALPGSALGAAKWTKYDRPETNGFIT